MGAPKLKKDAFKKSDEITKKDNASQKAEIEFIKNEINKRLKDSAQAKKAAKILEQMINNSKNNKKP